MRTVTTRPSEDYINGTDPLKHRFVSHVVLINGLLSDYEVHKTGTDACQLICARTEMSRYFDTTDIDQALIDACAVVADDPDRWLRINVTPAPPLGPELSL